MTLRLEGGSSLPLPYTKENSETGYFADQRKPHAVLIPFPLQGHINPLFKLAKLLHLRGFHITFVHTEYNHKRLLKSRGPNALDGLPDFRFETIPDGLPPMEEGDGDVSQDVPSLCDSIRKNFLHPFCDLIARLNNSATAGLIPPITCLVADCFMPFTTQAAEEFALPIVLLCPASACAFLTVLHFHTLFDKGLIPLKDESYLTNGYLDTEVDWIPDQPTNCRYICNEWDIGTEIDTNVKREEVEKQINELMVGEEGKKMSKRPWS
ncbi:UDP-glucosyltransferase family protein [Sesbania bispinosa]|nr:UDP-glucosyltransferase family protein [Sesbania bispinosa]